MKILLAIGAIVSLTSMTSLNSAKLEFTDDYGFRQCRAVTTDCGGGSRSSNVACVKYSSPDQRISAIFAAEATAHAMGAAACKAMAEFTQASVTIDR